MLRRYVWQLVHLLLSHDLCILVAFLVCFIPTLTCCFPVTKPFVAVKGTFEGAFPTPIASLSSSFCIMMAGRRLSGRDTGSEETPEKKAITNCFDKLCQIQDIRQILPSLMTKRVVSMTRCKELQAAAATDVIGANTDLVINLAEDPKKVHAFCEALLCETATEHIGVQLREGVSTGVLLSAVGWIQWLLLHKYHVV